MNLTKGVSNLLTFPRLMVGVGWDVSGGGEKGFRGRLNRRKGVDLDLAAVAFDSGPNPVRMTWFDNLDPFRNGSLVLSGDNTTGKGEGDDEFITVDFNTIPQEISAMVFLLTAFKEGVNFSKVEGVTCRIVDQSTNTEHGRFYPPINARQNAIVMGRATRMTDSSFSFSVVNTLGNARNKDGIINLASANLS